MKSFGKKIPSLYCVLCTKSLERKYLCQIRKKYCNLYYKPLSKNHLLPAFFQKRIVTTFVQIFETIHKNLGKHF